MQILSLNFHNFYLLSIYLSSVTLGLKLKIHENSSITEYLGVWPNFGIDVILD